MGSLLSAEEGPMRPCWACSPARGLFFLDSRTSAESVGYRLATGLGIPAAERQVFLDGDPSPEAIQAQFQRLLALARTRGSAIAIGHPYPETLAALDTRSAQGEGRRVRVRAGLLPADAVGRGGVGLLLPPQHLDRPPFQRAEAGGEAGGHGEDDAGGEGHGEGEGIEVPGDLEAAGDHPPGEHACRRWRR